MYWIGLQPGDVHLNVSSPGWAKHRTDDVFKEAYRKLSLKK